MAIKINGDTDTASFISLPVVALLVTMFGYTGYIATQLGGVQQQVVTSTKTLDENRTATERLATETKTATERLAAENRTATEKLATAAAAAAAVLAIGDAALKERIARLETALIMQQQQRSMPLVIQNPPVR